MNYSKVIVSQSLAAFEMLRQTIIKCPSVNNSCGEGVSTELRGCIRL